MPTATFKFLIPKGAGNLNNGISLNLGSKFTATIEKSPISRITAVTCNYAVASSSHRSGAQFQATLSNGSSSYTSDIITKTLNSSGGYVATINNTFATLPPASFFNNASGTTVLLEQIANVGEVNLRYKSASDPFYVTITVTYEGGPSVYVYDGGWKEATPYVYTSSGWKEATLSVYSGGWK